MQNAPRCCEDDADRVEDDSVETVDQFYRPPLRVSMVATAFGQKIGRITVALRLRPRPGPAAAPSRRARWPPPRPHSTTARRRATRWWPGRRSEPGPGATARGPRRRRRA